jgi:hypothetical protein
MTTNDDLARWGEPPASAAELAQAQRLGEALEGRLFRGEPTPQAPPGSEDLVQAGAWLDQLVASVLERSQALEAGPGEIGEMRGPLNQSLAAQLPLAGTAPTAELRLLVGRSPDGLHFAPLAPAPAAPGAAPRLEVSTGERVRLEAVAGRDGFLTVGNVGPAGHLNLLHPDRPAAPQAAVPAHHPLHVTDVELRPPAGREVLFALWTRAPLPLPDLLRSPEAADGPGQPALATADLERLYVALRRLPPEDWQAVVLEVAQVAPLDGR